MARATADDRGARTDLRQFASRRLSSAAATLVDVRAGLLRGEPEAVHGARVALRRTRSDLHVFRFFDRDATAPIDAAARALAGTLGTIRDRDVIAAAVRGRAPALPPRDRPAVDAVLDRLARERAEVVATLPDSFLTAYDALVAAITSAAADPPLAAGHDPTARAAPAVRRAVEREVRKIRRRARRLGAHPSVEEVHALRKSVKRTRYAAQALHDLTRRTRDEQRAHALTRAQDALGRRVDATVTDRWLHAAAARSEDSRLGFGAAVLLGADTTAPSDTWRVARRRLRRIDR